MFNSLHQAFLTALPHLQIKGSYFLEIPAYFMEPGLSLPHLQEPATYPYPETHQTILCPIPLLED
jgi:hypothetical protein